jgi:hypothetical protein
MPIRIIRALAIATTVMIMVGCWLPDQYVPEEYHGKPDPWHKDKIFHGGMFALFGVLWMLEAPSTRRGAAVLAAGFGLAVITELGQAHPFVGRDPNLPDGLADSAGVLVGIAASWFLSPILVRAPAARPAVTSTGSPAP